MDLAFLNLVKEMRLAQKGFFTARGVNPIRAKEFLNKSKKLEKEVDQKIIELTDQQQKLF